MEPATEPHFCMRQGPDGSFGVDKLACARVYHVNLVVKITEQNADGVCCNKPATRMQLDRTRLILDHEGLRRLEPLGQSLLFLQIGRLINIGMSSLVRKLQASPACFSCLMYPFTYTRHLERVTHGSNFGKWQHANVNACHQQLKNKRLLL